jgi:hypothetical protein
MAETRGGRLRRVLRWLAAELDKGNPESDSYRLPRWVTKDDTATGLLRRVLAMDRRGDGYVSAPDDIQQESMCLDGWVMDLTPDEVALIIRLRGET